MRKKLVGLCDLDGIVTNLLGPWLADYNRTWGDTLAVNNIVNFDFHRNIEPRCGEQVYEFLDRDTTFLDLEPLPGAIEGIKAIEEMGHEILIVTAGGRRPETAAHKLEWCQRHLGFSRKKVFIGHRKERVHGDFFIDDSPRNIRAYRAAWPNTPIMTIAYGYNHEVGCLPGVNRYQGCTDTAAAWASIVNKVREIGESDVVAR